MNNPLPLVLLALLSVVAAGCGGTAQHPQHPKVDLTAPPTDPTSDAPAMPTPTASSVVAFLLGPQGEITAADLRPMMSPGEAYYEKWDLRVFGGPYEVRAKFEVANLGFGDFKGRVTGDVKRMVDGATAERFPFDAKYSEGKWSSSEEGFRLQMGDIVLAGEPGHFSLTGNTGGESPVQFDVDIVGETWRPGTGMVSFGDSGEEYYRAHLLITQGTATGTVVVDGSSHPVEGQAYGNQLASNVAVYEMARRLHSFSTHQDGLFVEWRSYQAADRFDGQIFGYLVVSYEGQVVFESWDLTLSPLVYWVDDKHYGYSVENGLVVSGSNGTSKVRLTFKGGEVRTSDPLAKLPGLERAVAERFAKPIDYRVSSPWRLELLVDGLGATVSGEATYAVTVTN